MAKTKLLNTSYYSSQGKRPYQEDNLTYGEYFLLVADGVGGLAKGDVASKMVAEHLIEELQSMEPDSELPYEQAMELAVDFIERKLNEYASENSESQNMGSTLAMILKWRGNWYSTHIGDSRCYNIGKNGQIKWKSKDHSLVQELVDKGIISAEEALRHPRKNVITRVIQSGQQAQSKAEVHLLDDVEHGDRFLVCTDGVLESWDESMLIALIHQVDDNEVAMEEIKRTCDKHSADNNTAILATVVLTQTAVPNHPKQTEPSGQEVSTDLAMDASQTNQIISEQVASIEGVSAYSLQEHLILAPAPLEHKRRKRRLSKKSIFLLGFLTALICLILYLYLLPFLKANDKEDLSNHDPSQLSSPQKKSPPKHEVSITHSSTNVSKKDNDSSLAKNEDAVFSSTNGREYVESETFVVLNGDQPDISREENMFNQLKKQRGKTLCLTYLNEFPKGKYAKEVKTICKKILND